MKTPHHDSIYPEEFITKDTNYWPFRHIPQISTTPHVTTSHLDYTQVTQTPHLFLLINISKDKITQKNFLMKFSSIYYIISYDYNPLSWYKAIGAKNNRPLEPK